MEIELKDVLHFYVGCEVDMDNGSNRPHRRTLIGIGSVDGNQYVKLSMGDVKAEQFVSSVSVKDIKIMPILRLLSDITKEEAKCVLETIYNATKVETIEKVNDGIWFRFPKGTTRNFVFYEDLKHGYPEGFAYLLKQRFDLFLLIDSGQAIDKTTLK